MTCPTANSHRTLTVGTRDRDSSNHSSCVTQHWILPPRRQVGSHPHSVCDKASWAQPKLGNKDREEVVVGWGCVWDKPSSLPQLLLGFKVNWKQHRGIPGMAEEEGLEKDLGQNQHRWAKPQSGGMLLEMQTGTFSPNKLTPSQHWEVLGCQRERGTCKYLSLWRHACVSLMPYLAIAKLKRGKE